MRRKTVSEIIASRLRDIRGRRSVVVEESKREELGYVASRMAGIIDKDSLDNEDRLFLLQYVQEKERVCFGTGFPVGNIRWIVQRQKMLVDRNYDSSRTSLYVFRGNLCFYQIAKHNKEAVSLLGQMQAMKQMLSIGKYQGVGQLFQQKVLQKCIAVGQNIIALAVEHDTNELKMIQKNCLLTSKQKQEVVGRFNLFEDIDNFKKNYLPFFKAMSYSKNDIIYEGGDEATHFYLIVRGEVEFFQMTNKSTLFEKEDSSPIKLLRRKQNRRTIIFVNQKLGEGCCFGQVELISNTMREFTARCLTASCLLLMVELEIFQKLMDFDGFAQKMKSLSNSNKREKQSKMQTFVKMQQPVSPQPTQQIHQNYNFFKTRVLNRLEQPQKAHQARKLSLRRSKHKILHGHSVKIPKNSHCVTQESQLSYSMLRVNESMYLKTLKRFRHSLKEIEQQKKPKKKVELTEGRSLQKVWNVLGLREIFSDEQDAEQQHQWQHPKNGRSFYQSHLKIKRNIRDNSAFRPKGLTTNCRLKREYLQYLQKCL